MTAHDDEAERAAADGGPRVLEYQYSTKEEIAFFVYRHEHQPGQRDGFLLGRGSDLLGSETEALQEKYWVELYGDYGFQARTCARCNDSVTPGLRLCDPCANNEEA